MSRPPRSTPLVGADAGVFRYVLVEKHILAMIEAGELRPGDRMPSLRDLGNRLGVSVSTINQAYLELERRGLAEARPRSGFFVRARPIRSPAPRTAATAHPPTTVNRGALIREVLDGMGRRDILPLGVAQTDESFLPTKALARLLAKIAGDDANEVTTYEGVRGNLLLRRQIAWRLAEAGMNSAGQFFGDDRILDVLHHNTQKPVADLLAALRQSVDRFCQGTPPRDDMSVLGVEFVRPKTA